MRPVELAPFNSGGDMRPHTIRFPDSWGRIPRVISTFFERILIPHGVATVHLLVGPVGSGKTTYGLEKAAEGHSRVFLDLDSWMVRLYAADPRPEVDVLTWYMERRQRCADLLRDTTQDLVRAGMDVYLELGLVRRDERLASYRAFADADLDLSIHYLDAPRDVRRDRVKKRNESAGAHTQIVSDEFFELASDAWEPLDHSEMTQWKVLLRNGRGDTRECCE